MLSPFRVTETSFITDSAVTDIYDTMKLHGIHDNKTERKHKLSHGLSGV